MALLKTSNNITALKTKLENLKANADKAKVQEEFLLKQLKTEFECDTLEEAMELLDLMIDEKTNLDNQVKTKTEELTQRMQEEGFI